MGTTDDFFHAEGRMPVVKDKLKSLVSEGAMLYAVLFSILADIPSRPVALVGSRATSRSHTSDSEQSISSGRVEVECGGATWGWMGGWDLLKQFTKNELSRFAFSRSDWATASPNVRVGIDDLFLFKTLIAFQNFFRISRIEQTEILLFGQSQLSKSMVACESVLTIISSPLCPFKQ